VGGHSFRSRESLKKKRYNLKDEKSKKISQKKLRFFGKVSLYTVVSNGEKRIVLGI